MTRKNVCIIVKSIFDQICFFFIFYFWYTWEYKYQYDHQVFLFSTANETVKEKLKIMRHSLFLVAPQI